jgi:hypothetical protein
MPTNYPYIDPTDPFRVARFVFDGWKNPEQKNEFHGSVGFLVEEASGFRFKPSLKGIGFGYIDNESDEEPDIGTVPGSVIQVPFNSDYTTIERITKWFVDAGLSIHPADPPYLDLTTGPKIPPPTFTPEQERKLKEFEEFMKEVDRKKEEREKEL